MTRAEKLKELISNHFGIEMKYPKEFEAMVGECERCPVIDKCEEIDVCCIDEWWESEYDEVTS